MRKLLLPLMILLGLLGLVGCTEKTPEPPAKPKVAATIFPLYDMIRNVAGDGLDVQLILPPGASPHTFDLTPQSVERLQETRIIFKIGHGLDDWTENVAGFLEDPQIVTVDQGIKLIDSTEQDHADADAHGHNEVNPHYWLSVEDGEIIAQNIANGIIAFDPANEATYRGNLEAYKGKLDGLKADIEEKLKPVAGMRVITFHDSWAYYAREFGLDVVATIEPFPGKQPTPRYLVDLQQTVEKHGIHVLFTEPQLSSDSVRAFVEDLGLRLYVLDPLGGVAGRESYIALMQYNTDTLVEALSHERR